MQDLFSKQGLGCSFTIEVRKGKRPGNTSNFNICVKRGQNCENKILLSWAREQEEIERLYNRGAIVKGIADKTGVHIATVYRELPNGYERDADDRRIRAACILVLLFHPERTQQSG